MSSFYMKIRDDECYKLAFWASHATGSLRYLLSRRESTARRVGSTLRAFGETNGSRHSCAGASRSRSHAPKSGEPRAGLGLLLMAPHRMHRLRPHYTTMTMSASSIHAWATPPSKDLYGELSGGGIRIACAALLCGRIIDHHAIVVQSESSDLQLKIFPSSSDDLDHSAEDDAVIYILPLMGGKGGCFFPVDGDGVRPKSDYDDESLWFQFKSVKGILLRLTGDRPGEFCRVGSFVCGERHKVDREEALRNNRMHDFFNHVLKTQGGEVAERVCGEICENKEHSAERYVITVV